MSESAGPAGTRRDMLVTVVMAVHNQEDSIGRAIESVRRQTWPAWELVVVDDGSTDETSRVVGEFADRDRRVRVLRNEQNSGLTASLNRGWRSGRGEFIARLDADDECLDGRLEAQVVFLQAHPEVDILGTGAELVDEQGLVLGRTSRPELHEKLVTRIYAESPFIHPSVMMRRRALEALGGYDEAFRRAQDTDLWLRAYRRFRFHNLPEPLIRYRVRRAPTLSSIYWGTCALARAARREGRLFSRGWYAVRFLAACLLTKARITNTRLRPVG